MAILSSSPDKDNKFKVYNVPDADLQKYEMSGEQAAQMFPKRDAQAAGGAMPTAEGAMGSSRMDNAEALGEVQAYGAICICWYWECDAWGNCWRVTYYCYC